MIILVFYYSKETLKRKIFFDQEQPVVVPQSKQTLQVPLRIKRSLPQWLQTSP
jgi:hypothetical protein